MSGPVRLVAIVEPATAVRQVTQVLFFADGRQVCSVAQPPFECEWDAGERVAAHQTSHPEGHERLLIAMRAIYDTRSAGKTIGTADDDRQRFNRYATAYAAAGGPEQALVAQWKKFVDR